MNARKCKDSGNSSMTLNTSITSPIIQADVQQTSSSNQAVVTPQSQRRINQGGKEEVVGE